MAEQQLLTDGATDFTGGQDASKLASKIAPNAYASGININIEQGTPTPRWAFNELKLKLPTDAISVGNNILIPYAEIFRSGRFQARTTYNVGAEKYVLFVISGILFLFNIRTNEVTVISLPNGDSINENHARVNWVVADRFLVFFDYPNYPVILEGLTATRSNTFLYGMPTSVLGAYNQNRVFIANAGQEITAGDPTGSLATPDAPITFEEVLAPASAFLGQLFKLPTNILNDKITAMTFLEFTDSSTGIGPLLVATANQIFSYNSQNPRSTWEQGQFGTALTSSGGIAGQRAFSHVNSDLFYVSGDGQLRTLSMSREEQRKWSRVPISREVQNWLTYNDKTLIPYTFVHYFNNKVFVAANPYRVEASSRNRTPIYDVAFGGIVSLGLDGMSTLGRTSPPLWEGLWTGVRPMDMVNVDDRCFVISKDKMSRNSIYELNPNSSYDTDEDNNIRYITSTIYSKEFNFNSESINKEAHSVDLDLMSVQGDFKVTVDYKPSHGHKFIRWGSFSHLAPWRSCYLDTSCAVNGLAGHSFRDLNIGSPEDTGCDPVSGLRYDFFKKLQVKIILEGIYWELDGYLIKSAPLPTSELITTCEDFIPAKLCQECNTDWYIGEFTSCLTQKT